MMDILTSAATLGPGGFAAGAGLKLITSVIGNWVMSYIDLKRQRELAIINADTERIKALQGGEDKASPMTQLARIILALLVIGTYCFLLIWLVVNHTDIAVKYPVDKTNSIVWELLSPFGVIDKGILEVSLLGILTWSFSTLIPFIAGFFWTKVGK